MAFKLWMSLVLISLIIPINTAISVGDDKSALYRRLVDVLTSKIKRGGLGSAACPDGFTALSNSDLIGKTRCYSIEGAKSTQADARTTCNAEGAQLAILNTKEVFDEVHTWLTTLEPMPRVSLWVDAQCREWPEVGKCTHGFQWKNGEKMSSNSEWRWDDGKPRERVAGSKLPPDGVAMYHKDNFMLDNRPSPYKNAKALCQIGYNPRR